MEQFTYKQQYPTCCKERNLKTHININLVTKSLVTLCDITQVKQILPKIVASLCICSQLCALTFLKSTSWWLWNIHCPLFLATPAKHHQTITKLSLRIGKCKAYSKHSIGTHQWRGLTWLMSSGSSSPLVSGNSRLKRPQITEMLPIRRKGSTLLYVPKIKMQHWHININSRGKTFYIWHKYHKDVDGNAAEWQFCLFMFCYQFWDNLHYIWNKNTS